MGDQGGFFSQSGADADPQLINALRQVEHLEDPSLLAKLIEHRVGMDFSLRLLGAEKEMGAIRGKIGKQLSDLKNAAAAIAGFESSHRDVDVWMLTVANLLSNELPPQHARKIAQKLVDSVSFLATLPLTATGRGGRPPATESYKNVVRAVADYCDATPGRRFAGEPRYGAKGTAGASNPTMGATTSLISGVFRALNLDLSVAELTTLSRAVREERNARKT